MKLWFYPKKLQLLLVVQALSMSHRVLEEKRSTKEDKCSAQKKEEREAKKDLFWIIQNGRGSFTSSECSRANV